MSIENTDAQRFLTYLVWASRTNSPHLGIWPPTQPLSEEDGMYDEASFDVSVMPYDTKEEWCADIGRLTGREEQPDTFRIMGVTGKYEPAHTSTVLFLDGSAVVCYYRGHSETTCAAFPDAVAAQAYVDAIDKIWNEWQTPNHDEQ